ncbi:oligosaccharide flippase family protein [Bradyrhizobium sp. sBnM-33]|uniref:oligosaccharide flippase family protein n=1 Tax=Bradyrhizobium sp. sBnM-33 TaxID=2831780 RepID=UPI001BD05E3B|nr:oligosaccharide flippase family protein [Bradyrhizobium sp. sBnM-33]WOH53725.1 oligosaccharide flippase family protein [Bradyrhizobium sp. sBnM-33]
MREPVQQVLNGIPDPADQSPGKVSLRKRVLSAGIWSLTGFGLSLLIRLGSNLLMTRLLVPEMFGVMAIASTVMVGLAMFSDVGLKQNVVQSKRGGDPDFLNTAWTIQILRGLLTWGVALCLCVALQMSARLGLFPANNVYAAPSLPYVIGVLSMSAVISGFESTKVFEASRGISLGRITRLEILSQVFGLSCMLVWVSLDRSIWALVTGSLGASLCRTVLSHALLPGTRNHWHLEPNAFREVIQFGKWILMASVLGFLVNSGDRLLLGGMVDATVLGYYAIASLFVGALEGVLAKIMGDVSFPAFSEVVRSQAADLKKNYYRFLAVIAAISYFTGGFLITFGESLIGLLYDRRYQDAGWILAISATVLLTVPFRLATQSFLAMGKPRLQSDVIMVRLIFLILLTPIGFRLFGLQGALWGIVFSHFFYIPIIVYYNMRHHLFDIRIELYLLAIVPIGLFVGKICAFLAAYWIWTKSPF